MKKLIITIDTEGDNLWSQPSKITTNNSRYLPRFQNLCEKYGFKTVYLTNYEMAIDPMFIEMGNDIIVKNTGEIGLHIHAWNNPPIVHCTDDDFKNQPYLIEYNKELIVKKVDFTIKLLQDNFNNPILSHRAGRWAINEFYLQTLYDYGIRVDCSVTPYVSWESILGRPDGKGGLDYCKFPSDCYFIDFSDIKKRVQNSENSILEVPVSIRVRQYNQYLDKYRDKNTLASRLINRYFPKTIWLRPNGRNLNDLLWMINYLYDEKGDYAEFILHSSELMEGGSPNFTSKRSISKLYNDLEVLFSYCKEKGYTGSTLAEYYNSKSHNINNINAK